MYIIGLVEDETDLLKLIKNYLEKANYQVVTFDKGNDALNYIGNKIDLWILDIMLGDDVNGYDIIKAIRKDNSEVPVIFTSARDQDLDKILGLELGSDDYITKPYSPKELVLRVNNIKEIVLTTLEFDLFMLFFKNKDKCFSREEILASVWGSDYFGSDRVVDDLIRRLRKKLPNINLKSIYGYGYRLS